MGILNPHLGFPKKIQRVDSRIYDAVGTLTLQQCGLEIIIVPGMDMTRFEITKRPIFHIVHKP